METWHTLRYSTDFASMPCHIRSGASLPRMLSPLLLLLLAAAAAISITPTHSRTPPQSSLCQPCFGKKKCTMPIRANGKRTGEAWGWTWQADEREKLLYINATETVVEKQKTIEVTLMNDAVKGDFEAIYAIQFYGDKEPQFWYLYGNAQCKFSYPKKEETQIYVTYKG